MSEWIQKMLKPILDDEYIKGFEAGVMAQKLKEDEDHNKRLHEMYTYGYVQGEEDTKVKLGCIEEISAEEFDRLTGAKTEIPDGFGFVGTMDDISLVLDEEAV
jgi:hypothetical protein